jgi:hypothetical protein
LTANSAGNGSEAQFINLITISSREKSTQNVSGLSFFKEWNITIRTQPLKKEDKRKNID